MIRRPPRSTQSRSSAASDVYKRQVVRRQLLEVAAEAGARHIKVVGDRWRDAKWPQERLISSFHELCEQAARVGTRIALEIQPWSAVYNVDKALEIVAGANHPA